MTNDSARADAYYERRRAAEAAIGGAAAKATAETSGGFKYPAKWKCLIASARVPADSQQIVMVLVRSGRFQAELGDIQITASTGNRLGCDGDTNRALQPSLDAFFATKKQKVDTGKAKPSLARRQGAAASGLFAAYAVTEDMEAAVARVRNPAPAPAEEEQLEQAIAASLHDRSGGGGGMSEEEQLKAAMKASLRERGGDAGKSDEEQLRAAMAMSLCERGNGLSEEDQLRAAMEASIKDAKGKAKVVDVVDLSSPPASQPEKRMVVDLVDLINDGDDVGAAEIKPDPGPTAVSVDAATAARTERERRAEAAERRLGLRV